MASRPWRLRFQPVGLRAANRYHDLTQELHGGSLFRAFFRFRHATRSPSENLPREASPQHHQHRSSEATYVLSHLESTLVNPPELFTLKGLQKTTSLGICTY